MTHEGNPRRSGFELEFAGLSPEEAASIVQQIYGGDIEKESRFVFTCKSEFGEFDCLLDAKALIERKHQIFLKDIGIDLDKVDPENIVEAIIEKGASLFVPCEITTPPLVFDNFNTLNKLTKALESAGAKGTTKNIHYAFGLHINLEVPDLNHQTLLAYIQAYLLLEPYIKEISSIDLTRRLTAFIDPFPLVYTHQVLSHTYSPTSIKTLMRDYFTHNPTRNRALDMTPIFGTIDRQFTKESIQEPDLLKPRPALHYRLPNCSLGEPKWSIATEWNRFMLIEKLALNHEARYDLLTTYEKIQDAHFFNKKPKLLEAIKAWVSDQK